MKPEADDPWRDYASVYFRVILVLAALDANHDYVISASEIANAPTALRTLDQDHDGKLEHTVKARSLASGSLPILGLAITQVLQGFGQVPLSFEQNQGQIDPPVRFLSRGSGYGLFFTANEAVLSLQTGSGGQ